MKDFFKELFEYGHHFNQKLGTLFIENQELASEKSVKLFSHVLNAHQIWNNRIDWKQQANGVWELRSIPTFNSVDQENFEHSLFILDYFDLNDMISYTNSSGNKFTNNIRDILFHAINHSTYHRGQIASDFKLNGIDPPITDYIFYKR